MGDVIAPVAALREERVTDPGRAGGEVGGRRRHGDRARDDDREQARDPGALSASLPRRPNLLTRIGRLPTAEPLALAAGPVEFLGRHAGALGGGALLAHRALQAPCRLARPALGSAALMRLVDGALDRMIEPLPDVALLELGPELGKPR